MGKARETTPEQRFLDMIYLTQMHQAEAIKIESEHYRRLQYLDFDGLGHCMGSLYWQLQDIWQGPSWASLGTFITLIPGEIELVDDERLVKFSFFGCDTQSMADAGNLYIISLRNSLRRFLSCCGSAMGTSPSTRTTIATVSIWYREFYRSNCTRGRN